MYAHDGYMQRCHQSLKDWKSKEMKGLPLNLSTANTKHFEIKKKNDYIHPDILLKKMYVK